MAEVLLKNIAPSKLQEIAAKIAVQPNWRNIGLYFEEEYGFVITEGDLKAGTLLGAAPPVVLCEQLLLNLASRNVTVHSLCNVLKNQAIGMNSIADQVAALKPQPVVGSLSSNNGASNSNVNSISNRKIDVAIIVPLNEEFTKLKEVLRDLGTKLVEERHYPNYYYCFTRNGVSCAIRVMDNMTNVEASNAVHLFLEAYTPKIIIAAGCAGSIQISDVKLLDVVAATDCEMPFAKAALVTGDGKLEVEFAGDPYKSSPSLLSAFRNLHRGTSDEDIFEQLIKDCQNKLLEQADNDEATLNKWQRDYKIRHGKDRNIMQDGAIASSDFVGKSDLFGKWIRQHNRKYVAVEMEGGGVASALHSKDRHLRFLILRGITDAADEAKNGMEPTARSAFRYCGIYNVMRVLVALIDSKSLKDSLDNPQD